MGKEFDFQTANDFFFKWLGLRQLAEKSMNLYRLSLKIFEVFCRNRGKTDLRTIMVQDIKDYQIEILSKPLSKSTQGKRVYHLKVFFNYLVKNMFILADPTEGIWVTKENARKLTPVLSPVEVEKLIEATGKKRCFRERRWLGLRDQAMLELFYSSGLRLGELLRLKVNEVDIKRGLVFIVNGKGGKDRVVPVGQSALGAIEAYLAQLRPKLAQRAGPYPHLFLSERGTFLEQSTIAFMVRRYAKAAGILKRVHPHLLRHTMATHLLQNGAPLQVVSSLLGHSRLETTQIYTHLVLSDLRKAWSKYHPRGKWTYKN